MLLYGAYASRWELACTKLYACQMEHSQKHHAGNEEVGHEEERDGGVVQVSVAVAAVGENLARNTARPRITARHLSMRDPSNTVLSFDLSI